MNPKKLYGWLNAFDFTALFVEGMGWNPPPRRQQEVFEAQDALFEAQQVAELSGVVVLEVTSPEGTIPDVKTRAALHKKVSEQYLENLLIFVDRTRTQSLWYWVKREGSKTLPRDHLFIKGQPGDLLLSKLSGMVFDLGDFDDSGNVSVVEVARRLKDALDVERTTKKFYAAFQQQHVAFLELIDGIPDERARRWYASVLLNRLMFIYFLQRKGFLDKGKTSYLQDKLELMERGGKNYFTDFLRPLFFEGFAKPAEHRTPEARQLLGEVKYLNGGLFLQHAVKRDHPNIHIPNEAFRNLLGLFSRYSWNLNDLPGEADDEINPDVLGYIFEKYINQKAFGAYYTRPEITEYLCEQTINRLILEAVNTPTAPGLPHRKQFSSVADLLMDLDAPLCRQLLFETLPNLSLLDPACGSGAFLVAALKTLINIYSAIIGKVQFLHDRDLTDWYAKVQQEHPSVSYYIKKRIINDNLYGVDLMEEATDIAKLRLFLTLVASADSVQQLEPLPNIDFNIMSGNSLMGLMRVDPNEFNKKGKDGTVQAALFGSRYQQVLDEKNRRIEAYRTSATFKEDLAEQRADIQTLKQEAYKTLNTILLDNFKRLGIKVEEATWESVKNKLGKPRKRTPTEADIAALTPFHWGYEFDAIFARGGFDAIITNPPWDIFKPNTKEFFLDHSALISKKKMDIKAFEQEQVNLLKDAEVRSAWEDYLSSFPHVSAYYRAAPHFTNQIGTVNGRKVGSNVNLYKLFTEQCYNLLRLGGQCGIVIPSGIYTDLGAKQLREMLFGQTHISGLFCFENRKEIFENVHRSFKIVVLSFEKGGHTETFPAAFMRHDVGELESFPDQIGLDVSVELVKRLSPDSLSVMEFKNDVDVQIAEKLLQFPLLSEKLEDRWNLILTNEFHMRNDSHLFRTSVSEGRLPLFTGKMFHHFSITGQHSGYWIEEKEGRAALLGRTKDVGQLLDYQGYRWVHRRIARNTDTRTLISTITPKMVFTEVNSTTIKVTDSGITNEQMLFLCGVANSFTLDWTLRQSVTTTLNMFFIYQLPIPRLTSTDTTFTPIVARAAKLICIAPEFDDLAAEVGLGSHENGVTDVGERAELRAELDGLVAHLYGLTESEFAYILTTFPLVEQSTKEAALSAFRSFALKPSDASVAKPAAFGEAAR